MEIFRTYRVGVVVAVLSATVASGSQAVRVPRAADIKADFCAFECPNAFVIGYGMDLARRYRELPFVGRIVRP